MIIVSGLCWASYSLIGRGSRTPLVDTAGNFLRSAPIAVGIGAWGAVNYPIDMRGVVLAIASGAIASSVGYAIWYAVLPALTRTRAAIVQLTVPAIAALGGVILLGEVLTPRLLLASAAILGGVAIAIIAGERRKRVAAAQA